MPSRESILKSIMDGGIIAIVRLKDGGPLERVADAIVKGGICAVEFTLNTPGAIKGIKRARRALGSDALIGAGTVLDRDAARMALDAGAEFLVAPDFNPEVVAAAHEAGKVAVPGAFTPTEIAAALHAQADLIKLFPAAFLGPEYVKAIAAPLSNARLVPTGGVTLENIGEYVRAGAAAVAIGGSLVSDYHVQHDEYGVITETARLYKKALDTARSTVGR